MLKIFSLLAVAITISAHGYSQENNSTDSTRICFIRNTGYNGSAIAFHCLIDSNLVCNLKNKKFSVHDVNPGQHKLYVRSSGKTAKSETNELTITVEKGKTYYIKMLPGESYNFGGTIKLLEVSESTAKTLLVKCKQETECIK
jgi:hypothetical protein